MTIGSHSVANAALLSSQIIKGFESLSSSPENVGDNTITLGYGYTFIQKGKAWGVVGTLDDDLEAISITITQVQKDALTEIARALNSSTPADARPKIAAFNGAWTHSDLDDSSATVLLSREVDRRSVLLSGIFKKHLNGDEVKAKTLYDNLVGSREMVGLLSLVYNAEGLIGKKLVTALYEGDRATAWYEIRYKSNGGEDESLKPGLAKRRFMEADTIGMYADNSSPTAKEAADAYRMLQANKVIIFDYEQKFGNPVDGGTPTKGDRVATANNDYKDLITDLKLGKVASIEDSFTPAKNLLLDTLRGQFRASENALLPANSAIRATSLYIGLADTSGNVTAATLDASAFESYYKGSSSEDVLVGNTGADCLKGGKGQDILIGLAGNDTLNGGDGRDILVGEASGMTSRSYRKAFALLAPLLLLAWGSVDDHLELTHQDRSILTHPARLPEGAWFR